MSLIYPGSETLVPNTTTPPGSLPLDRPDPIMSADALCYLLWELPDLDRQSQFLTDFGFLEVEKSTESLIMRGYGDSPYLYVGRRGPKHRFIGLGFLANSRGELSELAEATGAVVEALDRPGGGDVVRLTDPNGLVVEVCFGIERARVVPTRDEVLLANTPNRKIRVNEGQRAPLEPAPVIRLGHCVTGANNMEEVAHWYMLHLGLIPSDVLCLDDGSPMIAFMRLDRGDKPADHHCFVVGKGGGKGYLHSAYEVVDVDAIGQGQQYLKSKQYEHVWGIGRHILGSQIFDYWKDPSGHEFEHYADGDVFTSEVPTSYHPMDPGNVYAWGQDMPKSMLAPGPKQILQILAGLLDGSVSFGWLKAASRAAKRSPRPWI